MDSTMDLAHPGRYSAGVLRAFGHWLRETTGLAILEHDKSRCVFVSVHSATLLLHSPNSPNSLSLPSYPDREHSYGRTEYRGN